MDFISVFNFLLETFQCKNIDFALIGGFALQSVGITRTTGDIDLLILSQDSKKVKDIMIKHGYELIHESKDVLNFYSERMELGRVDFLLAHRKYAIAMLKRAEKKYVFGGKFKIKVLKVEDQIGLKVQSSSNDPKRLHQDMADIELLIKNNYPKLDIALLKDSFQLSQELKTIMKIFLQQLVERSLEIGVKKVRVLLYNKLLYTFGEN